MTLLPAVVVTVFTKRGKVFCNSKEIARAFSKEHKHVLRDIRELGCSVEFRRSNFGPNKIKDLSGENTSHVDMTRDGFMFLVMGYTGDRAAQVKEAFIAEFNRMEEALNVRRLTVRESSKKVRNTYTKTLQQHQVTQPREFARATNSIYRGIWGKDAAELRKANGLPDKCNVREHMSEPGLAATMFAEALASARIAETNRQGIDQCEEASSQCALHVRDAWMAERASRKMIGPPE